MATILIYGATGAQGAPVARHFLARGHRVRLLARNPSALDALAAQGAEVVQGDMADPASLAAASAGVDGVALLVPFLHPDPELARNAIDAARAAGARRVIWNASGAIPGAMTGNPGADMRLATLRMLADSGLDYVALEPTVYMENLLGPWTAPEVAAADRLAYPLPDTVRLQWIRHEDIGALSVAAWDRCPPGGHRIPVCGPEALTGPDAAAAFSRALGRTIRYRAMPPAEFGATVDRAFGGGGDEVAGFYAAVAANPALMETGIDHAALLDRLPIRPTTLEDFARAHAAAFTLGVAA